ncbi:hypothetical protein ACWDOR_45695 [Streptosporangium canum]|uniref:hypothetical protein n=1 Tax=Streptosporangium canum TaxID=324952 RepID=UPI003687B953
MGIPPPRAQAPQSGKTARYGWRDLAMIARRLHLGDPVPATPEERDEIRAT